MPFITLASCFLSRAAAHVGQVHLHPFAGFPAEQPQPHLAQILFTCFLVT